MTPNEIGILDLLAERDRAVDAKLDAIAGQIGEMRSELRAQRDQLVGVATGAEIASFKRYVGEEFDSRDRLVAELANRVDRLEARIGERDAVDRWKSRAWAAIGTVIGLLIALAGVVLGVLF